MKKYSKRMRIITVFVALFVLTNVSIANGAGFYKVNCNTTTWRTTTKVYTFKLSDFLSKYSNIIKFQPKEETPEVETPVEPEEPVNETPVEPEEPVNETPVEPEEPVNETPVEPEEPIEEEQPSNDEGNSNVDSISAIEKEVVRLVNIERQKNGLSALEIDTELSNIARLKSQDMAEKGYFSHTSPTYGSPFDMMKQFGIRYSYAGENIAKGQSSAESVVNAWMNSEGHRANILSPNFTKIGVGYYKGNNGSPYWTQMFIKPY